MLKLYSIAEFLLRAWILTFAAGITKLGPFPVKALITLLFLFSSLLALFSSKNIITRQKVSLLSLAFWIAASTTIGIINGYASSTASQATSLIISISVVITAFLLYNNNKLRKEGIEQTIYFTAIGGVLLKIFIAASLALGFVTVDRVNQILEVYLGTSSESIHDFGGFLGILPRMGNAGDLFFLVAFMFYAKKHTGSKFLQLWTLMLAFVLISYSRYLMVVFAVASVYSMWGAIRKSPLKTIIIAAIIFSLSSLYLDSAELILELDDRFTGQIQSRSDSIRLDMMTVLLDVFRNNFLFGIGMGGYVPNLIRSDQNLWMYELEYVAMLMQFGIFGCVFIFANYIIYILREVFRNFRKDLVIPMMLSTIFWLGTPIQSSLFTGTQSSLIVLSIFFLSRKGRSNENSCPSAGAREIRTDAGVSQVGRVQA